MISVETPAPLDLVLLHSAVHMDFLGLGDDDDRGQASKRGHKEHNRQRTQQQLDRVIPRSQKKAPKTPPVLILMHLRFSPWLVIFSYVGCWRCAYSLF